MEIENIEEENIATKRKSKQIESPIEKSTNVDLYTQVEENINDDDIAEEYANVDLASVESKHEDDKNEEDKKEEDDKTKKTKQNDNKEEENTNDDNPFIKNNKITQ